MVSNSSKKVIWIIVGVILLIIGFGSAAQPSEPVWLMPAIGGSVGVGGVIVLILTYQGKLE